MVYFANKGIRSFVGGFIPLIVSFVFFSPAVRAERKSAAPCEVVLVGYVGGLDTPDNPLSGIIEIRNRLRSLHRTGLCVETFSAYTWLNGYRWLMGKLAVSGGTSPVANEGRRPRIIIYGHSLGGWATLALCRKLAARKIPVELTVQVDSVGLTDASVPPNVKQAANYYRHAILPPYGRPKIHGQDPSATEILGNFRIEHANHVGVVRNAAISDLIVAKVQELYAAHGQDLRRTISPAPSLPGEDLAPIKLCLGNCLRKLRASLSMKT